MNPKIYKDIKIKSKQDHYITIKIKVEPRSSYAGIVGPYGDSLKVKLTAPPVEGKANKELIELLAKAYSISKKDIEIVSGGSSRSKLVKLYGVTSIDSWRKSKKL